MLRLLATPNTTPIRPSRLDDMQAPCEFEGKEYRQTIANFQFAIAKYPATPRALFPRALFGGAGHLAIGNRKLKISFRRAGTFRSHSGPRRPTRTHK